MLLHLLTDGIEDTVGSLNENLTVLGDLADDGLLGGLGLNDTIRILRCIGRSIDNDNIQSLVAIASSLQRDVSGLGDGQQIALNLRPVGGSSRKVNLVVLTFALRQIL